MRQETQWLPGLLVLGAGFLVALVFVWRARRSASFAPSADEKRVDLDRRVQTAMEALREHIAESHHLPAEEFSRRRAELELAAATAMKARDEHRPAPGRKAPPASSARPGLFTTNPTLKGALWGGLTVGFFAVLGILLTQEQKARTDGMEATGKLPEATQPPAQPTPQDRQLEADMRRLHESPEDVDTLAKVAHAMLRQERFEDADALTERGITVDPFHVETRIHRAMLRGAKGDLAGGLRELEHLATVYPETHEALLFAGAMAMELGEKRRALTAFERFLHQAPPAEQPPQLARGIAGLRRELGE